MRSIKGRLYRQNGIIIISIVLILEAIFLLVVRNYYFETTERELLNKAEVLGSFYNKYLINEKIYEKARYILENNSKDFKYYMQVFDTNQKMITDSNGLKSNETIDSIDIVNALDGSNKVIITRDRSSNERIMAVSIPLYHLDDISGVLRYVISIEDIDKMVMKISGIAIVIGFVVILVIFVLSSFLAKDIVQPIKELIDSAEIMAKGDFSKRTVKRNNDEIGKLSDTLNYMAKEIQNSNSIKNEFISSISHELRTPLTAIQGWSEIILCGEVESAEEQREGLKIISGEARRLSGLVEELLDFSKFQSGGVTLDLKEVDINKLVEDVYSYFKKRLEQSGIKASLQLYGEKLNTIGDVNRLKQVLINIIDNSIKFTKPNNTILIKTSFKKEFVIIRVEDKGIGISSQEIDKITEKFYKGKSKDAGSGIGLAICKEIIELHGGELYISSIENEGTKVSINLPASDIKK